VVLGRGRRFAPRGQQGEAAIAGDREQPRAHRVGRRAVAQRAVRPQEGLLQHILGVVEAAEHVAAERQQWCVMPFVDRLERTRVALAHERGEPCVIEPSIPAGSRACTHAVQERRSRGIYSRRGSTMRRR
jgi:hypothetical protein